MVDANANRSEGLGSATHLMIEALEKASIELDKAVKASVEQLTAFNALLRRNFSTQLNKLSERSAGSVDSSIEDIVIRKDDHRERLLELERNELENLLSAARDIREQLSQHSRQATTTISQLLDEQMRELHTLTENPQEHFSDYDDDQIETVGRYGDENKSKVEQCEQECEAKISHEAQKCDKGVPGVLAESKQKIDAELDRHQAEFEDKINSVIDRLSSLISMTLKELEEQTKAGTNAIFDYNDSARKQLTSRVDKWDGGMTGIGDDFKDGLAKQKDSFEQIHTMKLERKVSEVKDEIEKISSDAQKKLNASHKLFHTSLKRLEKKYHERLERLFAGFEVALAKEAKLPAGTSSYRYQTSHELRDLLHARLTARSTEIVKAFKRQVEQLDSEYVRISSSSQEKIDTIRSTALDGLDKQVRSMNIEVERVLRGFRNELNELTEELPQIEDAGRAAALAVMAYQSAMLSFGSE
jgi:hypothetical protein